MRTDYELIFTKNCFSNVTKGKKKITEDSEFQYISVKDSKPVQVRHYCGLIVL